MKPLLHTLCLSAALMLAAVSNNAWADDTIQKELASNPELSDFYQLLKDTDVLKELDSGSNYMVFAPVNSQMADLTNGKEKCMASGACQKTLGNIARNHLVKGVESLNDAMKYKSGIFSINEHHITLNKVGNWRYMAGGHNVIDTEKFDNGVLYITDGVLANPYELSVIDAYQQVAEPVVEKSTTTTQKTTIPDPACGPEGCPDKSTTVTTIKRTITEVEH